MHQPGSASNSIEKIVIWQILGHRQKVLCPKNGSWHQLTPGSTKKKKKFPLGRPKFKIENWATLNVYIGGKDMPDFRCLIRDSFF